MGPYPRSVHMNMSLMEVQHFWFSLKIGMLSFLTKATLISRIFGSKSFWLYYIKALFAKMKKITRLEKCHQCVKAELSFNQDSRWRTKAREREREREREKERDWERKIKKKLMVVAKDFLIYILMKVPIPSHCLLFWPQEVGLVDKRRVGAVTLSPMRPHLMTRTTSDFNSTDSNPWLWFDARNNSAS